MTDFGIPADSVDAGSPSDDAQRARVEQLRRDRAGSATAPSRPHPAQGARIAAAGIGMTAMLGLVGVMGYAQRPAAALPPAIVPPPPAQVRVVIHQDPAPIGATTVTPVTGAPASAVVLPSAPIPLTAQPVVRQASAPQAAPAARAPIAKTSGSR